MQFLIKYVDTFTGEERLSLEKFSTLEAVQLWCEFNTSEHQEVTLINIGDNE